MLDGRTRETKEGEICQMWWAAERGRGTATEGGWDM